MEHAVEITSFESLQDFKGEPQVVMHYYWDTKPPSKRSTIPLEIYDRPEDGFVSTIAALKLYVVTYLVARPVVFLNQYSAYEEIDSKRFHELLVKRKNDAVYYSAHEWSYDSRKGFILNPRKQILRVVEVPYDHEILTAMIEKYIDEGQKFWDHVEPPIVYPKVYFE